MPLCPARGQRAPDSRHGAAPIGHAAEEQAREGPARAHRRTTRSLPRGAGRPHQDGRRRPAHDLEPDVARPPSVRAQSRRAASSAARRSASTVLTAVRSVSRKDAGRARRIVLGSLQARAVRRSREPAGATRASRGRDRAWWSRRLHRDRRTVRGVPLQTRTGHGAWRATHSETCQQKLLDRAQPSRAEHDQDRRPIRGPPPRSPRVDLLPQRGRSPCGTAARKRYRQRAASVGDERAVQLARQDRAPPGSVAA